MSYVAHMEEKISYDRHTILCAVIVAQVEHAICQYGTVDVSFIELLSKCKMHNDDTSKKQKMRSSIYCLKVTNT